MNELEIRKIAKEEFMNNVMNNIDSTLIFTYIRNLERKVNHLQSKIDKAIEYIEKDTRWFDSEYASIYGELCDCKGYNANRLEVMVNPSNLLKILKEDK